MRSTYCQQTISFASIVCASLIGSSASAQCVADLIANGFVDGADLAVVLSAWGTAGGTSGADMNHDGNVNGSDLTQLLAAWGSCPIPPLPWATTIEASPDPAVVTDLDFRNRMIATGFPWRVRDNASNIEMLLVPPGTFLMGASPGDTQANANENPAHTVILTHAFYLGRTEVTQAIWLAEMGTNPSFFANQMNNPVERVSWIMVQPFCTQNNLRLPTEAEWEYACRAGTTGARYGVLNDIAWHSSNAGATSHVVGTKLPNALGFYDMLGNVWEMTSDWVGTYPSGIVTDPTGPASGTHHPMRGGSWFYFDFFARASQRKEGLPQGVLDNYGFRVAHNP